MAKKKAASKAKRTPAQKRATAKLVAMNKKKRAASKKKSAAKKRPTRRKVSARRRSTAPGARVATSGSAAYGRRRNPVSRPSFYAIVRRESETSTANYLYFDGMKFTKTSPYLKGPKSYMMELAQHVADRYPDNQIFVKPV